MSKKYFLGIFYKSLALWLHYIPLALVGAGLTNLIAHWFGFHNIHNLWFNLSLFFTFYLGFAISDQLVHLIMRIFGVKD